VESLRHRQEDNIKNGMGLYGLDSSGSGEALVVALVNTVLKLQFNKILANPRVSE
jgi:hypothetical protein